MSIKITETKEILIKDYLKQQAVAYTNNKDHIKRIDNEFKTRLKPHHDNIKNIEILIKKLKLTPEHIKELKRDKNAFNLIKKAFEKLLPKLFKE